MNKILKSFLDKSRRYFKGGDTVNELAGKFSGNGTAYLKSIILRNYPPDYQILCYNCNHAKHIYKICPHQEIKKEVFRPLPFCPTAA